MIRTHAEQKHHAARKWNDYYGDSYRQKYNLLVKVVTIINYYTTYYNNHKLMFYRS